MAHFPKPFLKKARKSWYVEINRKQIKLGFDKEEAFLQYHLLMQQPAEEATTSPESLVGIIDAFWSGRIATVPRIRTNGIDTDCNVSLTDTQRSKCRCSSLFTLSSGLMVTTSLNWQS